MLVFIERNSILKSQSQNLKSQQNPKPKVQNFVIGIWSFVGYWDLEIGN